MLGGDLVVESRVGEGSSFIVRLPAAAPAGTPIAK
jgi:signal transduction histidine kinase